MGDDQALTSEDEARRIFEAARLGTASAFADKGQGSAGPYEGDALVTPARDESLVRPVHRDEPATAGTGTVGEPSSPRLSQGELVDIHPHPELHTSAPSAIEIAPLADAALRASPRQLVERLHARAKVAREQGLFE